MGDLVAVDGIGAAVAGHAAKQRFHLRRRRLRAGGLAAAAPHGEHEHAPVGAVVDVADRVGPQKLGLGAGGNFLAHRRNELPGADEMLAGGIVGHVASFNASPRRSKVPLGRRGEYGAAGDRLAAKANRIGRIEDAPAYGRGSSFIKFGRNIQMAAGSDGVARAAMNSASNSGTKSDVRAPEIVVM